MAETRSDIAKKYKTLRMVKDNPEGVPKLTRGRWFTLEHIKDSVFYNTDDTDDVDLVEKRCGFNLRSVLGKYTLAQRVMRRDSRILHKYFLNNDDLEHLTEYGFHPSAIKDLRGWLVPCGHDENNDSCSCDSFCWRCHQTNGYYFLRYIEDQLQAE